MSHRSTFLGIIILCCGCETVGEYRVRNEDLATAPTKGLWIPAIRVHDASRRRVLLRADTIEQRMSTDAGETRIRSRAANPALTAGSVLIAIGSVASGIGAGVTAGAYYDGQACDREAGPKYSNACFGYGIEAVIGIGVVAFGAAHLLAGAGSTIFGALRRPQERESPAHRDRE